MPIFGYGKPMTQKQRRHYREVRQARKEQGLPVYTDSVTWDRRAGEDNVVQQIDGPVEVEGSEHPLLEMRLRDTQTGDTYIVDAVTNAWSDGYYIRLTLREEGTKSHTVVFWENISCEHEALCQEIEKTRERYEKIE